MSAFIPICIHALMDVCISTHTYMCTYIGMYKHMWGLMNTKCTHTDRHLCLSTNMHIYV